MRVLRLLVRILLLAFLPAVLMFLGADKSPLDTLKTNRLLGDSIDVPLVKQVFQFISVLITSLGLYVAFEYNKHKVKILKGHNSSLVSDWKTSLLSAIAVELNDPHFNSVKLRVWKEKKTPLLYFAYLLSKLHLAEPLPKSFGIIVIEGLSDIDNTDGLSFQVHPNPQGVVGKCFQEGVIKYEEDVSGLDDFYNLTPFQKGKTRGTKFCLCCPIYSNKNEVVTIISLDSIYSIRIPSESEDKVANMLTMFSQDLIRYFPRLAK